MKKLNLLFLFLLVFGFVAKSQTTIIDQKFDNVTAGPNTHVAQLLGDPWTTWSIAAGGAEDPAVMTTQSSSAPNSVYVSTNSHDLVVKLGDKTTGRYKISFKIFVETGKLGFFNVLHKFAASDSKWATQVYFKGGKITMDAGGLPVPEYYYTVNAWNNVVLFIDIDEDLISIVVNGSELFTWKYSIGTDGTSNIKQLAAVDFFGWNDENTGTPGYYIDDFLYEELPPVAAVTGFTAGVVNDFHVKMDWTEASVVPEHYTFFRNEIPFKVGSVTEHIDSNVYPSSYNYLVRAFYANVGYSAASDVKAIEILGGTARKKVLYEATTSIKCAYCPLAAQGLAKMVLSNKDVAIVEYHNDVQGADEFANPVSIERTNLYFATQTNPGNPISVVDGTYTLLGVYPTADNMYTYYLSAYNLRNTRKALHDIKMNIVKKDGNTYTATIIVDELSKYYAGKQFNLRVALTETNISFPWMGQTKLEYVCRNMYPNASGTQLDFSTESSKTITFDFSLDGFEKNNCELVAWVQIGKVEEVTQVNAVKLSTIVGVENDNLKNIAVYPNPTSNSINIETLSASNYEIYGVAGHKVLEGKLDKGLNTVDIGNLSKGLYFVNIVGKEVVVKQFVVE